MHTGNELWNRESACPSQMMTMEICGKVCAVRDVPSMHVQVVLCAAPSMRHTNIEAGVWYMVSCSLGDTPTAKKVCCANAPVYAVPSGSAALDACCLFRAACKARILRVQQ
jgi:hypothetical protein